MVTESVLHALWFIFHWVCLPFLPVSLSLSLPPDTLQEERTALFVRKLEQCCYIFDFADPMSEVKAKEIKRAALNEILDYISSSKGALTDPVYPEIVRMVRPSIRLSVHPSVPLSVCLSVRLSVCLCVWMCVHGKRHTQHCNYDLASSLYREIKA